MVRHQYKLLRTADMITYEVVRNFQLPLKLQIQLRYQLRLEDSLFPDKRHRHDIVSGYKFLLLSYQSCTELTGMIWAIYERSVILAKHIIGKTNIER